MHILLIFCFENMKESYWCNIVFSMLLSLIVLPTALLKEEQIYIFLYFVYFYNLYILCQRYINTSINKISYIEPRIKTVLLESECGLALTSPKIKFLSI